MSTYLEHRRALKNGTVTPVKKEHKPIAAISEKKKAADKAAKPEKELLDEWFEKKVSELTDVCMECGGPTKTAIYVMDRECVSHVLPKRKSMFPSVATHDENAMELCTKNGCHHEYDSSWENASKMKVWPIAVEKFKLIYPSIAPNERKNIPDILLQEVEPV
jgi:hypothetical protein